jgi:hypothetical protein
MLSINRGNVEDIIGLQGFNNYDEVWRDLEYKCCLRITDLLQGIDNDLVEVTKVNGRYYYEK